MFHCAFSNYNVKQSSGSTHASARTHTRTTHTNNYCKLYVLSLINNTVVSCLLPFDVFYHTILPNRNLSVSNDEVTNMWRPFKLLAYYQCKTEKCEYMHVKPMLNWWGLKTSLHHCHTTVKDVNVLHLQITSSIVITTSTSQLMSKQH